jgi:L-amino acid N-acyltransferase YncA
VGNEASLALHAAVGFRTVGRRERIAQRDGIWHDTVLLELRLP